MSAYLHYDLSDENILKAVQDEVISGDNRHEFTWFCQGASTLQISKLLNSRGIALLKEKKDCADRLNGLISTTADLNPLFDNNDFLELFCSKIKYTIEMNQIYSFKCINYCLNNNKIDYIKRIFPLFNDKVQCEILLNFDLKDYYNSLLIKSDTNACQIMINNISSLKEYSLEHLCILFRKGISIPINLIEDSVVCSKINSIYDEKEYRNVMNMLEKCCDTDSVWNKRKEYYSDMLDKSIDIYALLNKALETKLSSDECLIVEEFLKGKLLLGRQLIIDEVYIELLEELKYKTSNMIVDYLFKDKAFDVFSDIKELLRFNKFIPNLLSDNVFLYKKILELDKMDINEKYEFFLKYKDYDFITMFYDDYHNARELMVENFNNNILNNGKLVKYFNFADSYMMGVPVYYLEGDKFYGLVKSTIHRKDKILTLDDINSKNQGSSFSIDSSETLCTFRNTKDYYNFIYGEIPVKQLVHVYENDSGSSYLREDSFTPNGTNCINRLFSIDDLIEYTGPKNYNELIISQPTEGRYEVDNTFGIIEGVKYINLTDKNKDEVESNLEMPSIIALYCYDEITDNDILTAKNLGIGIVCVKTKSYTLDSSRKHSYEFSEYTYGDMCNDEKSIRGF